VTAVQAYAKINAQGQWIDRTEQVNLNELFERMTQEELEMYARDGQLPVWFTDCSRNTEGQSGGQKRYVIQAKRHFCPQQIRPLGQEISQWVRRHRGPPPGCF
jgi:hypothetical protein